MDADLKVAIVAWVGLGSPTVSAYNDQNARKQFVSSTREIAELCFTAGKRCPTETCQKKGVRCMPNEEHNLSVAGTLRVNNTLTFDAYEEIAIMDNGRIDADDGRDNAPILYSLDSKIVVIPFRAGVVRDRDTIFRDAELYLATIMQHSDFFTSDEVDKVVICGHSQGAVMSEAIAYLMAQQGCPFLSKVFVTHSGAHLWMTKEICSTITETYPSRFAAFVAASRDPTPEENVFDCFVTRFDTAMDGEELVSLPRVFLDEYDPPAGKATTKIRFTEQMTATHAGPSGFHGVWSQPVKVLCDILHMWTEYEQRFVRVFRKDADILQTLSLPARQQSVLSIASSVDSDSDSDSEDFEPAPPLDLLKGLTGPDSDDESDNYEPAQPLDMLKGLTGPESDDESDDYEPAQPLDMLKGLTGPDDDVVGGAGSSVQIPLMALTAAMTLLMSMLPR